MAGNLEAAAAAVVATPALDLLTELHVELNEPVFVKPAEPSTDTSPALFLTNIDQNLAFVVETIYFYEANAARPSDAVADTLKEALSKVLVHYDFLAGRVRLNEQLMRMEVHRNSAGVQFSTASCDQTLAQLGDVSVPNALFRKFVPQALNASTVSDIPLLMFQVTTFKCGGHVIGIGNSHICWDGHGFVEFLFNLMSVAQGGPLMFPPKPDERHMFKAREPPTPTFDHPELIKLDEIPASMASDFTAPDAALSEFQGIAAPAEHITKMISFSAEDLATLKNRAMEGGVLSKVSTFDVISGHVWQARTKAMGAPPHELVQLLYAVDIRNRVQPPLPKGFVGNAIYPACVRAVSEEVCQRPLSFCVQQIQKANETITNDYVRSGIDWLEAYRGVVAMTGGIFISSWQKMPFFSIDFGWGKPIYAAPAVSDKLLEFVVILPPNQGDGGLNIKLCLQPEVMTKFEQYAKVSV